MTGRFEIMETGWRTDGLFIVILGSEIRALLEHEDARHYACLVAARRRCKTPVKAEPVIDAAGKIPFRRTFCFSE